MLSSRQYSHHKIKQNLHDSLRKQRQLSNRITVLMIQKQKRLKQIQRRVIQQHDTKQLKLQKLTHKQQIQRSFEQQHKKQQQHKNISRDFKKELNLSIIAKQNYLLQTKHKWYQEIKKISQINQNKINKYKEVCLQSKKLNSKRIKLMELHGKQNIKQYWKDRVDIIQKDKQKQNQKNSILYQSSLKNISSLQIKQQKLLSQIKQTFHIDHNFHIEDPQQIQLQSLPIQTSQYE